MQPSVPCVPWPAVLAQAAGAPALRCAGEEGFALIGALIVALMILALGAVGIQSSTVASQIAANDLQHEKALNLAEAGIEHALSLMAADGDGFGDELANGGTDGSLAALGSVATVQGNSYRFHQVADNGDGYYVRVVDNFDERDGANNPTVDSDLQVKIISRGRVGRGESVVEVRIGGRSLFPHGVWTEVSTVIAGAGAVDSFNSNGGPYAFPAGSNGDLYTNGDINLSSGTTVWGDATSVGTVTTSGGASVNGATTQYADPLTFDPVAPCGPPYHSSTSGITGFGSWSYTPATGVLSGSGGAQIILADGTYCFADVVLSGGATLRVDGPVELRLTGTFDSSDGGVVNTTAKSANLLLFTSGTDAVKIAGGGGLAYMGVYARDNTVFLTGGGEFYGAIVARSLSDTGGTSVHYDEALGSLMGAGGPQRLLWREVKAR